MYNPTRQIELWVWQIRALHHFFSSDVCVCVCVCEAFLACGARSKVACVDPSPPRCHRAQGDFHLPSPPYRPFRSYILLSKRELYRINLQGSSFNAAICVCINLPRPFWHRRAHHVLACAPPFALSSQTLKVRPTQDHHS